jgi:hypothetical protein
MAGAELVLAIWCLPRLGAYCLFEVHHVDTSRSAALVLAVVQQQRLGSPTVAGSVSEHDRREDLCEIHGAATAGCTELFGVENYCTERERDGGCMMPPTFLEHRCSEWSGRELMRLSCLDPVLGGHKCVADDKARCVRGENVADVSDCGRKRLIGVAENPHPSPTCLRECESYL